MTSSPVYLITGATGPMAPATIELMAKRGDRLLLSGRNEARLAELEQAYGSPGTVETFAVDVTDPAGAGAVVAETVRRLGRLDGLVHMVGSFRAGPVMKSR